MLNTFRKISVNRRLLGVSSACFLGTSVLIGLAAQDSGAKPRRGYDGKAVIKSSSLPQPYTLLILCLGSDDIVIGTVEDIVREAHTPRNANGIQQHTVFQFRVQRSLKRRNPEQQFLNVRQNQGNLPWQEFGSEGLGMRQDGEPMLQLQRRYMLFLRNANDPWTRARGYSIASINGITGRDGEADELSLTHAGTWAQFEIRDGILRVPQEEGRATFPDWTFRRGPEKTLIGLTEAQATAMVELVLREAQQRIDGD